MKEKTIMTKLLSCIAAAGFAGAAMMSAAFAEHHEGDETKAADPRLGEKVDRICFASTINGWRSVKGEDDTVLLERGVNDWYKVNLAGGCDEHLFRSALTIGIDSHPGGGCVTRGDVIIVKDSPGFTRRCMIHSIYKWDEDAAMEDEEQDSAAQHSQ